MRQEVLGSRILEVQLALRIGYPAALVVISMPKSAPSI